MPTETLDACFSASSARQAETSLTSAFPSCRHISITGFAGVYCARVHILGFLVEEPIVFLVAAARFPGTSSNPAVVKNGMVFPKAIPPMLAFSFSISLE